MLLVAAVVPDLPHHNPEGSFSVADVVGDRRGVVAGNLIHGVLIGGVDICILQQDVLVGFAVLVIAGESIDDRGVSVFVPGNRTIFQIWILILFLERILHLEGSGDLTISIARQGQNQARLVKIQCGARQGLIEVEYYLRLIIRPGNIFILSSVKPLLLHRIGDSADQCVGDSGCVICLIKFGGGQEVIAGQCEAAVLVYRNPILVVI